MLSWLQKQANRGVLLVGFCELNGWQDLESLTDLPKNRPKIVFRAANAGFPYSHVMVNTQVQSLILPSHMALLYAYLCWVFGAIYSRTMWDW